MENGPVRLCAIRDTTCSAPLTFSVLVLG